VSRKSSAYFLAVGLGFRGLVAIPQLLTHRSSPYSRGSGCRTMLVDAKDHPFPRCADGPGEMGIKIWGAVRFGEGVKLNMKICNLAARLECEAIIIRSTQRKAASVCGNCCKKPQTATSAK